MVRKAGLKHRRREAIAENVTWMFGTGRSGNTWLSGMMGELDNCHIWVEPCVGELFGSFYYDERRSRQRSSKQFVLGDPVRKTWLKSIRSFVLDGVEGRFPQLGPDSYVVVKEQRGSVGAPLLIEALPESRMVLLVRDPRDVVASGLDGRREGGWIHEHRKKIRHSAVSTSKTPNALAKWRAERYMHNVGSALGAYEAHGGRKVLVRYEELRADTLETMERIYQALEIPVEREKLTRVVHEHSWENIPEEKKGEGKFYRKASPGGWQEDLTPEQAKIVEEVTAPLLEKLYPR